MKKYITRIGLFILFVCIVLLTIRLKSVDESEYNVKDLVFVKFTGSYQVGEDEEQMPFNKNSKAPVVEAGTPIYLKGYFSEDLPKGTSLMLHVNDIKVKIAVGGEKLLSIPENEEIESFYKGMGDQWVEIISPGISKKDLVDITVEYIYDTNRFIYWDAFFSEMYVGKFPEVLVGKLYNNTALIKPLVIILALGITTLVIGIILTILRSTLTIRVLLLSGFIWMGAVWCIGDFNILPMILIEPNLTRMIELMAQFTLPILTIAYASTYLTGIRKQLIEVILILDIIYLLFSIVLQLLGIRDLAEMIVLQNKIMPLLITTGIIGVIGEIVYKRKLKSIFLLITYMPLIIGVILELILINSKGLKDLPFFTIGFLITVTFQFIYTVGAFQYQEKRRHQMEIELLENRMNVMLSKIQPHFIYNVLNIIQYLCDIGDEKVSDVVMSFSKYLRGNMDQVEKKEPILLEEEIIHLEHYLKIEKLRYSNIEVIYDLKIKDILLPALTIQPLVENAIRYGVSPRESGGVVRISSFASDTMYHIKIEDNGVGFDTSIPLKNDKRSHIGIKNTKHRIEKICNGTLSVESTVNLGTVIMITLPKKR